MNACISLSLLDTAIWDHLSVVRLRILHHRLLHVWLRILHHLLLHHGFLLHVRSLLVHAWLLHLHSWLLHLHARLLTHNRLLVWVLASHHRLALHHGLVLRHARSHWLSSINGARAAVVNRGCGRTSIVRNRACMLLSKGMRKLSLSLTTFSAGNH